MELKGLLVVLVLVLVLVGIGSLSYVSEAYEFHVGGENGWVARPCEEYNHWAERRRFQVNDTLVFKYNKGSESESVHVVKKDDYYSCNANNSLLALTGGESTFKLDRSGTFFFISGDAGACRNGQRLVVVVLAVRCKAPPPAAARFAPPPPRDVINTASYSVAPAPAPSGSVVAGSVGWVLSVVCVGALSVAFW